MKDSQPPLRHSRCGSRTGAPPGTEGEGQQDIWRALDSVLDPELDEPVTTLGFVTRVEADGDAVAVDFRLPTYWCSPNFAWIMAEDMREALRALPWAKRTTVTLADHLFASRINAAVNGGEAFSDAFGEAGGDLARLRATFRRKAYLGRMSALIDALRAGGRSDADLVALTVGELRSLAASDVRGIALRPAASNDPLPTSPFQGEGMQDGPRVGQLRQRTDSDGDTTPPPPERGRLGGGQNRTEVQASRFDRTASKTRRARRLRQEATWAERKLWSKLRSAQIEGASFRRQHPVGPYVLDFYCSARDLAVELDGDQHSFARQVIADQKRDAWLAKKGIRVLRFFNTEVRENLEGLLETIRLAVLEARPLRSPQEHPLPTSPFQGEETQGEPSTGHLPGNPASYDAAQSPPPESGRPGGGQSETARLAARYLELRRTFGGPCCDRDPAFRTAEGEDITAEGLPVFLRAVRMTRRSAEANGEMCRIYLRERVADDAKTPTRTEPASSGR